MSDFRGLAHLGDPLAAARRRVSLADEALFAALAESANADAALIAAEEVAKAPCMRHLRGSSCVRRGYHETHVDEYGSCWTDKT